MRTTLKSTIILFTLLVFNAVLFSQGEANYWYFGYKAGLNFNGGAPMADTNGRLITYEGCATISDASGNLLFYTDGVSVWNQNHIQMTNGFGLMGDASSTQSSIIVQKPSSTTIYYIFTADDVAGVNGIRYSEVDMTLSGGLGDITTTKNILLNTPSCEKLTAIRHCNNRDVWVVTHDWNSNAFRCYLVTPVGVNTNAVISNTGLVPTGFFANTLGQLKASPDGTKIASATYESICRFELFDFNKLTGIVSNAILFPQASSKNCNYGVEFSPDGTKMYGADLSPGKIYQFDLCAGSNAAIANSGVLIGTSANWTGSLQLAPDKKIYLTEYGATRLGVINNPNILGIGCNFVDNGISWSWFGRINQFGLPNFVPYYFKQPPPPFTSSINCFTGTFTAPTINHTNCAGSTNAIANVVWDFGDPASGPNNKSTLINPTHSFTGSGMYNVKLTINYACGADTLKQNVTATLCSNMLFAIASSTNITCNGLNNGSATAIPVGGTAFTYLWSNGQTTQTAINLAAATYTVTITDATTSTATASVTITQPPLIMAIASSTTNCFGGGTATVVVAGGISPYTYSWSTTETTATINSLVAGSTYTLTVSDLNGCSNTTTVMMVAIIDSLKIHPLACHGDFGSIKVVSQGSKSGYIYKWSNGATTDSIANLPAGTYTVTVTDANGCIAISTAKVNTMQSSVLILTPAKQTIPAGESVPVIVSGGTTYNWLPVTGLNCTNCFNPTATPTVTTTYTVTTTDINGCALTEMITITVRQPCDDERDVYIANIFSPNSDGRNDKLFVEGIGLRDIYWAIYDRWGNLLFETNSETTGWDGTKKGLPVEQGTYVYYLRANCIKTGNLVKLKGNVTLIR